MAAQVAEAPARAGQLVAVPQALVAALAQAAGPGMEQSLVLAQAPAVLLRVEQPLWGQAQELAADPVLTPRVDRRRRQKGEEARLG